MTFNSILAPYLIAYSGLIALKYKSGEYDPSTMKREGCCAKTYKFLFLTCLGPLTLLVKQFVEASGDILALPLLVLTLNACNIGGIFKKYTNKLAAGVIGLSEHSMEGLSELESIGGMFFKDIPVVILQALILFNILTCPELKEEPGLVYYTLIKSMFNLIVQFYYQWKKGKAMGEGLIVQCLQNMTARITALPYQKKIRKKKEKKERHDKPIFINYGCLQSPLPIMTTIMGMYQAVGFQFTVEVLKTLVDEITRVATVDDVDLADNQTDD